MKNTGIHHVSVMIRDASRSFDFYHNILGLNLTLNTVNQDDITMYHLFFGDKKASAGTEFTLFEMKNYPEHIFGTSGIDRLYFSVPTREALDFWVERLDKNGIENYGIEDFDGSAIVRFEDHDGMRLGFVVRETISRENQYVAKDIPADYAIIAIGQVDLRLRYLEATEKLLREVFGFESQKTVSFMNFETTVMSFANEQQHEVHLIHDNVNRRERLGVGGMHHVAFGVIDHGDLLEMTDYLDTHNMKNSGIVDREFFEATYFREPNGIVIEVSSAMNHESFEVPEQKDRFEEYELTLPAFLEPKRAEIEGYLNR